MERSGHVCGRTQRYLGFTLIELMVAVAVVAILAAVAIPSYTRYVVRANRSAAQSYMYALANKQEQYRLDYRAYTTDVNSLLSVPSDVARNYTVAITTSSPPPAYTITATPGGAQAARDTQCGALTLTQDGVKGITGTGTASSCW